MRPEPPQPAGVHGLHIAQIASYVNQLGEYTDQLEATLAAVREWRDDFRQEKVSLFDLDAILAGEGK